MKSARFPWWWHRLRAMSLAEMGGHARKKLRQQADARRHRDWQRVRLVCAGAFPRLPPREPAPAEMRSALRRDTEDILRGRWRAFGHLDVRVDDPPNWQCDDLDIRSRATTRSAFALNHRALPAGTDIKLIWEPSRWYQLARLAQAAYLLDDAPAARKCLAWLSDWVARNPPYRGWNWTIALEAGMRLIQFTWIDALLADRGTEQELAALRYEILPAHVWFTWRHKSFGTSANNHLLGELTGLIVATARWPALAAWGAPLEKLHELWDQQVRAQFAEDGGNKEQSLGYHLFAWEFCWQARAALAAAGRRIAPEVDERLRRAAQFFVDLHVPGDPWDYGDSDGAFVSPVFNDETKAAAEWHEWFCRPERSPAIDYWWHEGRRNFELEIAEDQAQPQSWRIYEQSGLAVWRADDWTLRWDLSLLGYLRPAAHGHLDALHLSIWRAGVAVVVDPGTGCYGTDLELRAWLASRAAHNGPCPAGGGFPRRLGPFLWAEHHEQPRIAPGTLHRGGPAGWCGELRLPSGSLRRHVVRTVEGDGWEVGDRFEANPGESPVFSVRWQFAPGASVEILGERRFAVTRAGVSVVVGVGEEWSEVRLTDERSQATLTAAATQEERFAGTVSPAFRKVAWGPFLELVARPAGEQLCLFRTTFLASARS